MDRLTEMEAFVTVVDQGAFTSAAVKMGVSKSAVSKHIAALEARLGARLLDRTTRRVSPTEIGVHYYERAKRVLVEASNADDMVSALQTSPRGLLRVSVPVSFGVRHAATAITSFLKKYPEVKIDLSLNDNRVDLISEGYDLAIRIGTLADSSLRARKIAETRVVTLASPEYLEKHGTPDTLDSLSNHQLLQYSIGSAVNSWPMLTKSGEERNIRAKGALAANNGDVLKQAMIDGIGIGHTPTFFLDDELEKGLLVEVLPDHPQPLVGIYVVYPPGLYTQPKTRAFIDFMVTHFKDKGPKGL